MAKCIIFTEIQIFQFQNGHKCRQDPSVNKDHSFNDRIFAGACMKKGAS